MKANKCAKNECLGRLNLIDKHRTTKFNSWPNIKTFCPSRTRLSISGYPRQIGAFDNNIRVNMELNFIEVK